MINLIEGENPIDVFAGNILRHRNFSTVIVTSHDLRRIAS